MPEPSSRKEPGLSQGAWEFSADPMRRIITPSKESERNQLLNLLEVLIQSEDGAVIFIGYHGYITVKKGYCLAPLLQPAGEISRFPPSLRALIQDSEGLKEILNR